MARRDRSQTVTAPAQGAPTSNTAARTAGRAAPGVTVTKQLAAQRPTVIPQITRFGMIVPRKSPFDSLQLTEVRKIIARALSFDAAAVGGPGLPGGVFTSFYLPGAQVSVSSMDSNASGLMGRLNAWDYIQSNRAFLAGDHWQGGNGWAGPWPRSGTDGSAATVAINDIAQRFVSHNVLSELADRHITGVVGREPQWGLSPRRVVTEAEPVTAAEQRLIDEASASLTIWWDERKGHEWFQKACATLLLARRSSFRLYVPAGALKDVMDEAGKIRKMVIVNDFTEAMMTLWLDNPAPERSTVTQDDATKELLGALLYDAGKNVTGDGQPREVAEVTYVDPATGVTVLRSLDKDFDVEWSADLGGRILMHEMERPLFLTPQLQQKQKALNLAITMLPRHLITAGFLERVILNASMPGRWIKDPTTGDPKGKWVPDAMAAGPGVVTFLQGVEDEGKDGVIQRADPQVVDRPPISPEPTVSSVRAMYELMLEAAAQAHVLMNKEANASGLSREQARADYERSLTTTAPRIERAGRWLIETLLAVAEALSGKPGFYTKQLRATFSCRIDTGPVDPAERAQNSADYKEGLISRETAMARNGIADPDAEIAAIDAQPGAELGLIERMVIAWQTLVSEGVSPEAAARIVGFSEEDIKELMKGFVEPTPPVPPGDGGGDGGGAPPVAQ